MNKLVKAVALALCLTMTVPVATPIVGVETVEAASKVKLNYKKKTIYVGDTFKLKITGTKKKVKWSSANKKIATVSSKGVVKGIRKGTAKITASVGGKKYTCKMTVKAVKKQSKVAYISNRSVQYVSEDDLQRFFFALEDEDMNQVSSSGTVDIRIENGGVVVYQKKVEFTESDFGYWTSKLYGEQYLCSIDIPISDIQLGKYDSGLLYYTINEKNVSFDEYSLSISNLPKEQRKIDVDTSSMIPDKYAPENKAQIISYNINNDKIFLTFKITQLANSKYEFYSTTIYEYDKNGNILEDHFIYCSSVSVGTTFVEDFYLDDETIRIGISVSAGSSQGNSDNTGNSTITKPSGSVAENISQLKQLIKTNGKINVNGEKFISETSDGYTSSIVYESSTDSILFVISGGDDGLTMKMTSADNSSVMQVDFVLYSGGIGLTATGVVNPATYTLNSSVYFVLMNANSSIIKESDIQNMCNAELRAGFSGWQVLLYGNFLMNLKDIGFTSYN